MATIIRFIFFHSSSFALSSFFPKDQGFQDSVVTGRLVNDNHGDAVEPNDSSVKLIIFHESDSSYFLPPELFAVTVSYHLPSVSFARRLKV